MYRLLLCFLFLFLPLIHTKLFDTLGFPAGVTVAGNFEFTKVVFFQIIASGIFVTFLIEKIIQKEKIILPGRTLFLVIVGIIVLFLSSLFSLSPYISFLGNGEKSHSFLLFTNLIGLLIVLYNTNKKYLKKLLYISYISVFFVCILALKEYFSPTFDYGQLSSRAIGTFGHPNYLALFLLLFFPFLTRKKKYFPLLVLVLVVLVFTKSLLGVVVGGVFVVVLFFRSSLSFLRASLSFLRMQESPTCKELVFFSVFSKLKHTLLSCIFLKRDSCIRRNDKENKSGKKERNDNKEYNTITHRKKRILIFVSIFVCIFIIIFVCIFYFGFLGPEKLHSFLSRFFIWETTLKIIFSDWKIFVFGGGLETLEIYFNSFKVLSIYIFENFGFTADRPHNIFLNVLYHTGIFGLGIFVYLIFLLGKHIRSHGVGKYEEVFLVFFVFSFFNYPSIGVYLFLVLVCTLVLKNNYEKVVQVRCWWIYLLVCVSLFSAFVSVSLYRAEVLAYEGKYEIAFEVFPLASYQYHLGKNDIGKRYDPLPSEGYYISKILRFQDIPDTCSELVEFFPSVENYFYCGNILERLGRIDLSHQYYRIGLGKLPDLWNETSEYWDNYFVKHTITGNRFFSEKFSDIKEILEKSGKSPSIQ